MRYVIFHKDTTVYLRYLKGRHWTSADNFKSEAAAKATLTRLAKKGKEIADYRILPADEFKMIEKTHVVKNYMNGAEIVESVNTPNNCSASSETYWSS